MVNNTTGDVNITFTEPAAPTALASLPPAPAGFTGRDRELAELLEALDTSSSGNPARQGVIVSVAGLPGVGKTSLALAAGHAGCDQGRFDGTLFVDLHGYDETPLQSSQALERLLRGLGVAQEFIPRTLEERQGLYHSRLSALAAEGRRVLVVADNASRAEQVRPLRPASGRHRLLVTSRDTLPTLGARLLDLPVLSPEAAVNLLDTALRTADPADSRISQDATTAQTLALLCGYLPLALQISAARLITDRGRQVAGLAAELQQMRTRLEHLDDGERAMRASFDLSSRHLSAPLTETFRLLALNPGSDISTEAAAVLTDQRPDAIRPLLLELAQTHLLEQVPTQDRWRMHDLIRAYAGEQADAYGRSHPQAKCLYERARRRLLEHYTTSAEAAGTHLDPNPSAARSPRFGTKEQAVEWLDAELPNLVAASTGCRSPEQQRIILRLPRVLGSYLNMSGHLDEWLTISQAARQAARDVGDRDAEAVALEGYGSALGILRREHEANEALEHALEISRTTRNRELEALVLTDVGNVAIGFNKAERALDCHRQALHLFKELEDQYGEAAAWSNMAQALIQTDASDDVFDALNHADHIYRRLGDESRSAAVTMTRGIALGRVGRLDEAITCFRTAAATWHRLGANSQEAMALGNLSWTLLHARRNKEALAVSCSAVEVSRRAAQESGSHVPSLGFAGALTAYAEALYRSRKNLPQAAAAVNEALSLFEQIPGAPAGNRTAARFIAVRILQGLGGGRKNALIRRQLEALLGPVLTPPVRRRGRWLSRHRVVTLFQSAWVAVVWCGFFHARQADTSVWLLILYCTAGLVVTGFIRFRAYPWTDGSPGQVGQMVRMRIGCMPRLLPVLTLIASLSVPELLGPFNTAGAALARILGLA
ncbi:ATP-binding protein [Streptomyces xantholiticus]|uniref:Tetratricopeptide repeat protein n=1 Tax=Streptomyces xantholiticus TaxID=68285 RepID=A0ABV1UN55_9ACTN